MKIKQLIVSLVFALALVTTIVPVSAETKKDEPVYVTTSNSELADKFASDNVYELVETLDENTIADLQTLKLGNGILIENLESDNALNTYFYPVFLNDTFKYIMRVVDNGYADYTGFLSIGGVEQIKGLGETTSYTNPATLYQSNGNLAYFTKNNVDILLKDNESYSAPNVDVAKQLKNRRNSSITINVAEKSDLVIAKPNLTKSVEPKSYAVLPIDYKETQGQNNWCSAYVSASAARFMTGNSSITAATIAKATGAGTWDTIEWTPLVSWWSGKGYNFNYWNGQVGSGTVATDLANRKPVYSAYKWYDGGWHYHALLIHGINGSTVKVWNPWYSYSESASSTTFQYTSSGGTTMTMYMFGRYSKK